MKLSFKPAHSRSLVVAGGVLIALVATALSALASGAGFSRASIPLALPPNLPPAGVEAATCTKMTASDVIWVTVNEDGEVDEQVESYPSETSLIFPIFEYNCVPKNTTIVSVFTYEGEQVYNDKEKLKASTRGDFYGYPLQMNEGVFDEGEWGIEFYNNKTLLTSGTVIIGEESPGPSSSVTVQGTVTDKRTKKPIKGALILVLQPDITIESFIDGGQQDEDVFTAAKTDAKGQFELQEQLDRDQPYAVAVVAKGYQPIGQDDFTVTEDDPDPLELNLTLTK